MEETERSNFIWDAIKQDLADGRYTEIFNSDEVSYGGSGLLNEGKLAATRKEVDGRDYSLKLKLAPAALAIFSYVPYSEQEKKIRAIKEEEEIKKEEERREKLEALKEKQNEEEQRLLSELKLKYEKELAEQEKAIEEKYEKIEEERIFDIVSKEAIKSISTSAKSKPKTAKKTGTAKKKKK